jgi:hypothetical protein
MTHAPEILLEHHLKTLKLPTFLREYQKAARQCSAEGLDHVQFLTRLVELELIDRERRMVERRIKAAKFPATKSLDSFSFKVIPKLNKMQVLELTRCDWIERRENVIALGPIDPALSHYTTASNCETDARRSGDVRIRRILRTCCRLCPCIACRPAAGGTDDRARHFRASDFPAW